ncbi:MAG TPA: hypothetical protein VEZ55_03020, partial [Chitinophagaceae bacterium]|nr:hypothetical protein [Chitinophagaceae bacterium]
MPIVLFFIYFGVTKKAKSLWIIVSYVAIFSALVFIYSHFFHNFDTPTSIRNGFYVIFTLFEYSSFTYFLWINVQNSGFKKLILFLSGGFAISLLIYYMSSDFLKIDSVTIGIETIIILVFSAYFLYERMNEPAVFFIYNDYRFWVVLGFMIYLAGSFFIYLFADRIPSYQMRQYWVFTDIFY